MRSALLRTRRTIRLNTKSVRDARNSVALCLFGCLIAASLQAEDCRRHNSASWQFPEFSFASWGDTVRSRIVLVDRVDNKRLDLDLTHHPDTGATLRPDFSLRRSSDIFPGAPAAGGAEQIIDSIRQTNGGFIGFNLSKHEIANTGRYYYLPGSIQWYDAALTKRENTKLLSRLGNTGELVEDNQVMSILDWQPVADRVFAYGALGLAGRFDAYREGFFITQLQAPGNDNVTPMARMVWDLHGSRHYVFHHDFIAVDGDIVYFLEMSTFPSLFYYDTRNNDVEAKRLEGFPGSDSSMAYPPSDTFDGMYRAIERTEIPVGLYASDGFLYALLRRPQADGSTSWRVIKLRPDIAKGRVDRAMPDRQSEVVLPTQRTTRHIWVLPSKSVWVVLELGAMPQGSRKHQLLAAVTVPQRWIAEPDKSPLGGRAAVRCLSAVSEPLR